MQKKTFRFTNSFDNDDGEKPIKSFAVEALVRVGSEYANAKQ
jgi:hypothetical protein